MSFARRSLCFALLGAAAAAAQPSTFSVPDAALGNPVRLVLYGDMRFHDPSDTEAANPSARRALVARIASEKPDAVQLTGDIPYRGSNAGDYAVFQSETAPWRTAGLRIYPALGNHELSFFAGSGLENWWANFPQLRGMRWYSVALGSRIELIQLDSTSNLADGSPQRAWLDAQLKDLPKTVEFVLIGLHHPPVADLQTHIEVSHNPRPNEIALRDYLTSIEPGLKVRLLVTAGHIHNYERAEFGGVTYLVSGGGGAHPYQVERTPQDLYQDTDFPNFHYVRVEISSSLLGKDELKATMFRLADPAASSPTWQEKDHFVLKAK